MKALRKEQCYTRRQCFTGLTEWPSWDVLIGRNQGEPTPTEIQGWGRRLVRKGICKRPAKSHTFRIIAQKGNALEWGIIFLK